MTVRYVDVGAGASSTYDPVTRTVGSGSFNNYISLAAAQTAAAAGDVVILRSGTEAPSTGLALSKAIAVRSYGDEIYTMPITGANHGINSSTVPPNVDCGNGQLVIQAYDAKALDRCAFLYNTTGGICHGLDFSQWTATCVRHVTAGTTITMDRCIVGTTHGRILFASGAAPSIVANAWLFNGGGMVAVAPAGTAQTITFNNPTFIGVKSGTYSIIGLDDAITNVTLTVNNPIVVGCNPRDLTQAFRRIRAVGAGSSVTINGGVLHRNLKDRSDTYNTSGTVTLNSVSENALVKFAGNTNRCFVTLSVWNSSYFSTAITGNLAGGIAAVAASRGVQLSAYLDDWHSYAGVDYNANIRAWISGGHELNSLGMSGDDDWVTTNPMRVAYAGANNPRLVIASNGTRWSVEDDLGTVAGPYNCGYGEAQQYLGVYESSAGAPPHSGDTVCEKLENDVSGLAVTYNTGTVTGWDDAAAWIMEDGTYALSGTPNATMAVNMGRRMEAEIKNSADKCHEIFGIYPNCMICTSSGNGTFPTQSAYSLANGYSSFMSGRNGMDEQTINTISPSNIYNSFPEIRDVLNDGPEGTTEEQIRGGARTIASYGLTVGGYYHIILKHQPSEWTADDVGYLIDELQAAGVEIVTFQQALALSGNVTISPLTSWELDTDSAGWGTSSMFWTNGTPNPVGLNGEPFSNFDTDCGAYQSTTGPFHPSQLR